MATEFIGVGPKRVQDLEIWREGMALTKAVYLLSGAWLKAGIYGLTSQARRAAVSVPANLAEGVGRGTPGEISRFSQIALGSAYELHPLLSLAADLELSSREGFAPVLAYLDRLTKRISRFIPHQESKR